MTTQKGWGEAEDNAYVAGYDDMKYLVTDKVTKLENKIKELEEVVDETDDILTQYFSGDISCSDLAVFHKKLKLR